MEISLNWNELKNIASKKGLLDNLQFTENPNFYRVFIIEENTTWFAEIEKSTPRPADQADFEDNYKAKANENIVKTYRNVPIVTAHSRPSNTYTCFTTAGDDVVNNVIGEGKRMAWDFSNNDDSVPAPIGFKRKRIEVKFLDPVWIKEGTIYYHNAPKGCYGDLYIVCPAGQVYLNNQGSPVVATQDTPIVHYVIKHPLQGSVPMGDELNTESATENPIPTNYKLWVEITTPDSDVSSNGYVELEIYRVRTIVL